MRVPALLLLSGLALGAAACTTTETTVGPIAETPLASSPQPVEGYDWFYHVDADEARLAYGLAESDDLRLGMDCRRGAGRLELSATSADAGAKDIHVESGGETERFPAASEPSEVHDGVFLTAQADVDAPVFQRFRRVGWLALWQGDTREAYAPHPASRDNIERFFAFCG
jgi:hypothetical protein